MNTFLSRPLVSFILPAYKARWLSQAIRSIVSQTYTDIELVIINDCSPENIEEIVLSFSDTRIRYYKNERNIGGKSLVKQWEHCIEFARGIYTVIAADDDFYYPEFTEECVRLALQYSDSDLIRVRTEEIDEENKLLGVEGCFPTYMSQLEYVFRYREGSAFICMGNFLFRAETLKQKGFVDFPAALGSDIATTVLMAERGVICSNRILFSFRQSTVHISGSKTHYRIKLNAITLLFTWLTYFSYPKAQNKYEEFYMQRLSPEDWYEKCVFDYYNQVIKRVPLYRIHYIRLAKSAKTRDKLLMLLRYIKDRII